MAKKLINFCLQNENYTRGKNLRKLFYYSCRILYKLFLGRYTFKKCTFIIVVDINPNPVI
jgi:hypothetical protein